jgi:hypothetical protein
MTMAVFHFVNVIFITICSMVLVTTKGMFVKRTFLNIPLKVFNKSVVVIDENENFNPHFDLDTLKENVTYFLNLNLKNHVDHYNISFYPYSFDDENEKYYINIGNDIKNVQIHFICNYFLNFKVDQYLCFSLNEKGVIKSEY